jgi:hypothetical protein
MASTHHQVLEPGARELQYARKYVWEFPVRLCHWLNVLSITVLFATGLYISSPLLSPNGEPWQNFRFFARSLEVGPICPLDPILPSSHARAASARVLKNRVAQSHLSILMRAMIPVSYEGGIFSGVAAPLN